MEDKKVIEIEPNKVEDRKPTFKEKMKEKREAFSVWLHDDANRDLLKVVIPAGVSLIGAGVKIALGIRKKDAQERDRDLKELYVYDRVLGHYWKLDHKLSSKEWRNINQRKAEGERLGDILWDMDVLE